MKCLWTLTAALCLSLLTPAALVVMAEDKDGDEHEEKVALDQCPTKVQETIKQEAAGGKIEDIAKETEGGATIYEVDIVKDGKEIEVKVDADGKVVGKKVEDDGKDEK